MLCDILVEFLGILLLLSLMVVLIVRAIYFVVYSGIRRILLFENNQPRKGSASWTFGVLTLGVFLGLIWISFTPARMSDYNYTFVTGMELPVSAEVIESEFNPYWQNLYGSDVIGKAVIKMSWEDIAALEEHLQADTSFHIQVAEVPLPLPSSDRAARGFGIHGAKKYQRPSLETLSGADGVYYTNTDAKMDFREVYIHRPLGLVEIAIVDE